MSHKWLQVNIVLQLQVDTDESNVTLRLIS